MQLEKYGRTFICEWSVTVKNQYPINNRKSSPVLCVTALRLVHTIIFPAKVKSERMNPLLLGIYWLFLCLLCAEANDEMNQSLINLS